MYVFTHQAGHEFDLLEDLLALLLDVGLRELQSNSTPGLLEGSPALPHSS